MSSKGGAHSSQYFAPVSFSCWHRGHFIVGPGLAPVPVAPERFAHFGLERTPTQHNSEWTDVGQPHVFRLIPLERLAISDDGWIAAEDELGRPLLAGQRPMKF